jgi:hypothetical protein
MLEVGNPRNAVGDPPYLRRPLTPDEQVGLGRAVVFRPFSEHEAPRLLANLV